MYNFVFYMYYLILDVPVIVGTICLLYRYFTLLDYFMEHTSQHPFPTHSHQLGVFTNITLLLGDS